MKVISNIKNTMSTKTMRILFILLIGIYSISTNAQNLSNEEVKDRVTAFAQALRIETDAYKGELLLKELTNAGIVLPDMLREGFLMPIFIKRFASINDEAKVNEYISLSSSPDAQKIAAAHAYGDHKHFNSVVKVLTPLADSLLTILVKNEGELNKNINDYQSVANRYAEALANLGQYDRVVKMIAPLYEMNKLTHLEKNIYIFYAEALSKTGKHEQALRVLSNFYLTGLDLSPVMEQKIEKYQAALPKGKEIYKAIVDSVQMIDRSIFKQVLNNKTQLGGTKVDQNKLKGKYIILDFWGSWCGPCRVSHPDLIATYNEYKGSGLEIIGIAAEAGELDKATIEWKKAIEEDGLPWIQLLDNENKTKFLAIGAYKITAYPTKIIVDGEGHVIARFVGAGDEAKSELKLLIKKLLNKA